MQLYKIAGINIEIAAKYSYLPKLCKKYECDETKAQISLCVSEEEIDKEMAGPLGQYSRGYCESVCAHRKLGLILPEFDAYIMHASAFTIDGEGYAITAKSGTGKSTHTRLLRELLGERADIINGDKPIIRLKDGIPYACGSPWCGKENWSKNRCARLKGIIYLERSAENFIRPLDKKIAARLIMGQIFRPSEADKLSKILSLVDKTLEYTDTWRLGCDISQDAAKLSYSTITGVKNEN